MRLKGHTRITVYDLYTIQWKNLQIVNTLCQNFRDLAFKLQKKGHRNATDVLIILSCF